jgi:hypothetical protein
MNNSLELSVFEIVGSGLCVASDDGQKVFARIAAAIREGQKVKVSFLNVSSLTSAFLNAAIGQLYGSFSAEEIRARLAVKDMESDDKVLLKRVVDTAKDYFKNPSIHRNASKEMFRGENEQ